MNFVMDSHIALVGLPGSGKSTIGRYLARRWSVPFVDVDVAIEEQIQCSIREFFAKEGEDRFREVEQDVLAQLLKSLKRWSLPRAAEQCSNQRIARSSLVIRWWCI